MSNIRIKDLTTTAATTASDDFIAVDGTTNGTRKLNAYSPTFGGNLTVSGTGTSSFAGVTSASGGSINITSSDPAVRLKASGTVVADGNTFEVRNVGVSGTNFLQFRTVNDANSVFTTRMALWNSGGLYLGTDPVGAGNPGAGNMRLSGNLTVSGASGITTTATNGAGLTHSTAAGSYRGLKLQTSSSDRWLIGANDAAESGSNAGSDLVVFSYSDAGTFLSSALKLVRSTGNLLLGTTTDGGQKLQVAGTSLFSDALTISKAQAAAYTSLTVQNGNATGYSQLNMISGSNTASINYAPGVFFKISIPSADSFQVSTNNTTALTLDSSQNATFAGSIKTVAPSGGTAKPWELGEAATVSPTSPNRTIRVEIDGTVYYIHAKTTND